MLPRQHETKQMPYQLCNTVVVTYLHKDNVMIRQYTYIKVNISMVFMCCNGYNTDTFPLCTFEHHNIYLSFSLFL